MIKIHMCALLQRANSMAKPAAKIRMCANKMADSCASNFNENSVAF